MNYRKIFFYLCFTRVNNFCFPLRKAEVKILFNILEELLQYKCATQPKHHSSNTVGYITFYFFIKAILPDLNKIKSSANMALPYTLLVVLQLKKLL